MPFAGDSGPVSPGEVRTISLDFGRALGSDTLASVTSTAVSVYSGYDANAAALLSGPATISGTVVSQLVGNLSPGFQPGVLYRWTVTVLTAGGQTLVDYMHVPCSAII